MKKWQYTSIAVDCSSIYCNNLDVIITWKLWVKVPWKCAKNVQFDYVQTLCLTYVLGL